MDLGAAASGKGAKKDEVILAVPTEEKDINALYADELKLLAEPIPIIKPTRSATQKQEDYYKVSPRFTGAKSSYYLPGSSEINSPASTDLQDQRPDGLGTIQWGSLRWHLVRTKPDLNRCLADVDTTRLQDDEYGW